MHFEHIDIRERDSLSEQIAERLKETNNTCIEALTILAISKKIKDDSSDSWKLFLELVGIYGSNRNDAIVYLAVRINDVKARHLVEEFLAEQKEN